MRKSAGLLLYRKKENELEVFLVHPGGPFWKGKDDGGWSIPKGEFTEDEDPLTAARREFFEETGHRLEGPFQELSPVKQKGGKIVYAWAAEGELDAEKIVSNTFKQEWPYKSGKWITVPEVDKAAWFLPEEGKRKINPAQANFIDQLIALNEPGKEI
ncbi:MAG: NUDIX domain-containing protein [Bacteroidota bacterium]|nr:NUDIX domain-containing protein [Bacteroidota bacterium]